MGDTKSTLTWLLRDEVTGPAKNMNAQLAKIGLAAGAGAAAFGLFQQAAGAVVGVLGDALKAAIADQESVSRLGASLTANVKDWDGNTRGIESNILAAQRLGFEDETLRDSLTVLVGATHSVTKAQNIQNIAMDLARFKGIDLRTASEALIKVEGGHYRALAQLGIKLKEGATQQDALNAVQKIAQGQAEAYAQTVAGKLVAAQIKWNEQLETTGNRLLPVAANALESLNTGVGALGDILGGRVTRETLAFQYAIGDLTEATFRAKLATLDAQVAFMSNQEAASHLRVTSNDLADAMGSVTTAGNEVVDMAKAQTAALRDLEKALFGGQIAAGDLAQAQLDLQDVIAQGPEGKKPGQWTAWQGQIADAKQKVFDLQAQMAQDAGPNAFYEFILKQKNILGDATQAVKDYLAAAMKLTGIDSNYANPMRDNNVKGGGGSGAPVALSVNLDGKVIAKIVDEHLYYGLQRSAPTLGRS